MPAGIAKFGSFVVGVHSTRKMPTVYFMTTNQIRYAARFAAA